MTRLRQVLLIIETSKAYGRGLLEGIGRYAWMHGPWSIYLEERSLQDRLPPWMRQWKGDGVIVRGNSEKMARTLLGMKLPVVETDPKVTGFGLPLVYVDDAAVARAAADHFLDRGLRRLAYCSIRPTRWSDLRRDAFVAEARRRGRECRVFRAPPALQRKNWQRLREGLIDWVRSLPAATGILAENDVCGMRLLDACRQVSLPVPERVAVLGVDNDPVLCELTTPPLSSIDLNVRRVGFEAAALLARLMAGRKPPRKPLLIEPLGVVARQSTDILAVEDDEVAQALRFIRLHACRGIAVQDVLETVAVSRRVLERRFAQCLGRTPKEEILRVQMNRARQLLSHTDLPIARIAEQTGFSSFNYFSNVFRRETGESPRGYRRRLREPGGRAGSRA